MNSKYDFDLIIGYEFLIMDGWIQGMFLMYLLGMNFLIIDEWNQGMFFNPFVGYRFSTITMNKLSFLFLKLLNSYMIVY